MASLPRLVVLVYNAAIFWDGNFEVDGTDASGDDLEITIDGDLFYKDGKTVIA